MRPTKFPLRLIALLYEGVAMKLSEEQKVIVKKYGHLFCNTGGNEIVELIEREGVTHFNNAIVAELQGMLLFLGVTNSGSDKRRIFSQITPLISRRATS